MPGTIYDAAIAGDGIGSLAGSEYLYAVCRITAVPFGTRELEVGSSDHILRAGWISFGDSLGVIGGVTLDYWREVWWLDFITTLHTPRPSGVFGGAPLSEVASRVRWHIPPGGAAWLYVFG
jgi:hypothetical protein